MKIKNLTLEKRGRKNRANNAVLETVLDGIEDKLSLLPKQDDKLLVVKFPALIPGQEKVKEMTVRQLRDHLLNLSEDIQSEAFGGQEKRGKKAELFLRSLDLPISWEEKK